MWGHQAKKNKLGCHKNIMFSFKGYEMKFHHLHQV